MPRPEPLRLCPWCFSEMEEVKSPDCDGYGYHCLKPRLFTCTACGRATCTPIVKEREPDD